MKREFLTTVLVALALISLSISATAGTVYVWGSTSTTQAGDDFIAVAAGDGYSLAVKEDGTITAWGANASTHNYTGDTYIDVAANKFHSIALLENGTIVGKGRSNEGQLVSPEGKVFVKISAGLYHNLGLCDDGTVESWGNSQVSHEPSGKYKDIAAGDYYNIALTDSGYIVVWGWFNTETSDFLSATELQTAGYKAVAAGDNFLLAVAPDGSIVGWDDPYGTFDDSALLAAIPEGNDFIDVDATGKTCVALRADGSIVSWGGAVGAPAGNNFTQISAGISHAVALEELGAITLLEPNGGQIWQTASVQPISWSTEGNVQNVLIEYSVDNGAKWIPVSPPADADNIIAEEVINDANEVDIVYTYNLFVPLANSNEVLVKVSAAPNPYTSDQSDANLTIYQCSLKADLTGDCVVDVYDLSIMAEEWLLFDDTYQVDAYNPVSFDDDKDADELDYAIFTAAMFSTPEDDNWNPLCDISFPPDNVINLLDFAEFSRLWQSGPVEPFE